MKAVQKYQIYDNIQRFQSQIKFQEPQRQQKQSEELDKFRKTENFQTKKIHEQKKINNRTLQTWNPEQIRRLFNFYDQYGPKWKTMSYQISNRKANSLKNRFYTVIRNLMKLLFYINLDKCPKQRGQIPSRYLSRLYDGVQEYQKYEGLLKLILQGVQYDLDNDKIEKVIAPYIDDIVNIYQIIYKEKERQDQIRMKTVIFENKGQEVHNNLRSSSCANSQQKLADPNLQNITTNISVFQAQRRPNQYYMLIINDMSIFWWLYPNF